MYDLVVPVSRVEGLQVGLAILGRCCYSPTPHASRCWSFNGQYGTRRSRIFRTAYGPPAQVRHEYIFGLQLLSFSHCLIEGFVESH